MSTSESKADIRYVLVVDFEATCNNDKNFKPMEIIEFPIVVLDLNTNEIVAEFHEYVRPVVNPILTPFCTDLTGIHQEAVDAADPFPVVYNRVLQFLESNSFDLPNNSLLLTCGDWDFETMFPEQLRLCNIALTPKFERWINVKVKFRNIFQKQDRCGMTNMLSTLGLPLIGRHHSGIDDARNIAAIARELIKRGQTMTVATKMHTANGPRKIPQKSAEKPDSQDTEEPPKRERRPKAKDNKNIRSLNPGLNIGGPSGIVPVDNAITINPVIDIGVNLTHKSLHNDIPGVLSRARAANVSDIIITGTDVAHSEMAIKLAREHASEDGPKLWCTVGVHPHDASRHTHETVIPKMKKLINANRDVVVAVGECGLDFDRNFSTPADQELVFERQLRLAKELDLPLFLHERSAGERFSAILEGVFGKGEAKGVVHCFTGEEGDATRYLELGLSVGITGWVCDERRGLGLADMVKTIPKDRLLVETDAPFLMPRTIPKKLRPKNCEPSLVCHVVTKVADCYGEDKEEIAKITTQNAIRIFGLRK